MTPDQPTATATSRTIEQAAQECAPDCIDAVLSLKPELQLAYVAQLIAAALREVVERELSSAQAALTEAKAEVARMKESYLKSQSLAAAMLAKSSDELTALRAEVAELEQDKARLEGNLAHAHYVKIDSLLAERAQLNEALTIAEGALNATLWRDLPDGAVLQVKIALAAINARKGQP